jgi:hypothetical protein
MFIILEGHHHERSIKPVMSSQHLNRLWLDELDHLFQDIMTIILYAYCTVQLYTVQRHGGVWGHSDKIGR